MRAQLKELLLATLRPQDHDVIAERRKPRLQKVQPPSAK